MRPARKPILCYVTDGRSLEAAHAASDSRAGDSSSSRRVRLLRDSIRHAATAGMDWIQIREKDLDTRSLVELARFAVAGTWATSTKILVNDRLDLALAVGASGVHLGEQSLPLESVNEWRRSAERVDFRIGVSCHSLDAARAAQQGGADYIFFGPVFATPSKAQFGAPQGIELLREACAAVEIPVLAIGGVSVENARQCVEAGAAGIAAIRLFQDARTSSELAAVVERLQRTVR